MKIIFFGTSFFAAQILFYLVQNQVSVIAAVTRPDRPTGRSLKSSFPQVKQTAIQLDLPIFQPEKASSPEFVEQLRSLQADLFIVVAYGEIVKKEVLDLPFLGCINIHASLLPKYRGAAPMQRCLINAEKETGISIIEMTPKMDAGDIISMQKIPIPFEMTHGELEKELCVLAQEMILQVIEQFKNHSVKRIPQDHSQMSLAPKISAQEEEIDWGLDSYLLHNRIRALSPSPGAFCMLEVKNKKKRLKVLRAFPENLSSSENPGSFVKLDKGLGVVCGRGVLRLLEVQLEGKKAMSASDCFNGLQNSKIIR
ncbi:methionyl-tRNA formyltransferase [Candidatus Rhabdochlamydia porcellionis]|jgi:methionyl-tRNA formyltransferase|uniref:Methionyl-tRNA formyltransferase n=1 Tax=Candidatus Rhabdochlamydia porcellionis TaxID=225148 RepID=A0ABX8Z2N2_9BACT|nr:methionyl-tRNA formyltransferase [Candidatus Rhabdochlamydia porcellionis]QZA58301.1 Methionyl-tRNA formyltransferase [Candidatus Rhabdochlamydia porcellionis]